MMAYKLLSEPIRKYVRDKHWESLRPIQASAIDKIINTDNNYILASHTASGKTEAAFLPILTKANFNGVGVQVLYISPLIALINDQFFRIMDLCNDLEIKVTKWHGEANRTLKKKLLQSPNGIVLITPESIEAMFVNAPYNVAALFGNLEYIIIDEIHSFLGADRGLQLMSLLSRIRQINKSKVITVGLSATIGDENYIEAKRLIGDIENTRILLDRTQKESNAKFKYFHTNATELSLDLIKDLYKETCSNKVLVFPNSRGRTEEVAVKLRKISDKVNGHKNYFSHHSSVDKEIRESIEYFAKNNERFNFCICCTSTLELGIDIGSVDKIVQIDSTYSVSSLVQRIGRSGRHEGEKSLVTLYATDKWNLLQSVACWNLYKADFLEPINTAKKPYDIFFHQMLSIVKELSGCKKTDLIHRLTVNSAFKEITEGEMNDLIDEAIKADYLEIIERELLLGIEGEKIVNSREFYSVFKTLPSFKVIHSGKSIGEVPFSLQIQLDENILLAARIWKIIDVDEKGLKIIVKPALDGKKPIFFGRGGNIHPRVREEMLRILKSSEIYSEIDEKSKLIINELRSEFRDLEITDFLYDRPLFISEKGIVLYTFTGTTINKSLQFLFNLTGQVEDFNDQTSSFELTMSIVDFKDFINEINILYSDIDNLIKFEVAENESLLEFSKWGKYLSIKYQCAIVKERYFDFENAINFLNNINLISSL